MEFLIEKSGARLLRSEIPTKQRRQLRPGTEWISGVFVEADISGGMGSVYVVRTSPQKGGPEKRYVLKTAPRADDDKYVLARLLKELDLWLLLEKHRNLAQLEATILDGIVPFLLFSYVQGESLRSLLVRRSLGLTEALSYAIQICDGMKYLEACSVVHRDLKPENLLVDREGVLKIIDLGLATVRLSGPASQTSGPQDVGRVHVADWRLSLAKGLIGTPAYMAPEVAASPEMANVQSDVYSAGMVFIEMLTGEAVRPSGEISGTHDNNVARRLLGRDSKLEPVSRILLKCIEIEQTARFHTFGELRQGLDELFRNVSGGSMPEGDVIPRAPLEMSNLAASLMNVGRPEAALRLVEKALQLDPNGVVLLANRSSALWSLDRHEEALVASDLACTLSTNSFEAAFSSTVQSHLRRLARDGPGALESIDRALEADADSAETWARKGIILRDLERLDDALTCFDRALDNDPRRADFWAVRGETLSKLGRYNEALMSLDRAESLGIVDATVAIHRGLALFSLGRVGEAHDYLMKQYIETGDASLKDVMVRLFKDLDPLAAVHLAVSDGRFTEAVRACESHLESHPDDWNAWHLKATALETLERYDEALQSYQKCLMLNPSHHAGWVNLGNVLDKQHQYEQAIQAYDKALQLDGRSVFALLNRAICLSGSGRPHEAIACCERALAIDQQCAPAWRSLAVSLEAVGRLEEALQAIEQALSIDPNDGASWRLRATSEQRLKRTEGAFQSFSNAVRLDPDWWQGWYGMSECLKVMNRKVESLPYLTIAAERRKSDAALWVEAARRCVECSTTETAEGGRVLYVQALAEAEECMI